MNFFLEINDQGSVSRGLWGVFEPSLLGSEFCFTDKQNLTELEIYFFPALILLDHIVWTVFPGFENPVRVRSHGQVI